MKKIVVNGREYGSVEEMPPDVRRIYMDALRLMSDRAPDAEADTIEVRESADGLAVDVTSTQEETRLVFDDREYSSLEELPPEARRMVRRLQSEVDAAGEAAFGVGFSRTGADGEDHVERTFVLGDGLDDADSHELARFTLSDLSLTNVALVVIVGLIVLLAVLSLLR